MATVAVVGVVAMLAVVVVAVVVIKLVTLTTEVIVVVVVVLAMATDEDEDTTVQVSSVNWQRLSARKTPGDSFDDVIGRVLDETAEVSAEPTADVGSVEDEQQDVDELIDGLDLPGTSEETVEARRDAVRACYEYLRDRGEARKSSFVDEVYPNNQARYDSENGWWNTVGKKGLRVLADDLSEVEPPGEGEHLWFYRSE